MAGYRWGQNKDAAGGTLVRDNFWWTGFNYSATSALTLTLGYYYDDRRTLKTNASQPDVNPVNPWQLSFIADYALSVRTDVYFTVGYARNSGLNLDSPAIGFANGAFLGEGRTARRGSQPAYVTSSDGLRGDEANGSKRNRTTSRGGAAERSPAPAQLLWRAPGASRVDGHCLSSGPWH